MEIEITGSRRRPWMRALIAPDRGGMLSGFAIDKREIFFLDRATFEDRSRNVRGGVPVLFPSPGKLEGDRWALDGRSGALPQHGFARNVDWQVLRQTPDGVALRLEVDAMLDWPWACRVDVTYTARGKTVTLDTRVENRSAEKMPFGLGFHPYFAVADKRTFRLESTAKRAFDNVSKQEVPFAASKLDLTASEVDLHLLDHRNQGIVFGFDDLPRVTIEADPAFSHWVLWSLPDRPFVCVEPWTCAANALNTGERVLWVEPGVARVLKVSISVD